MENSAAPVMGTKYRPRCTWTVEEKGAWVADWEKSGQTLSEFCRLNDLSGPTLNWNRISTDPRELLGVAMSIKPSVAGDVGGIILRLLVLPAQIEQLGHQLLLYVRIGGPAVDVQKLVGIFL